MMPRLLRLLLSWRALLLLGGVFGLWHSTQPTRTHDATPVAQPAPELQPARQGALPPEFTRLLLSLIVLILLGAAEFAASFLPLARSLRPLVMFPGVLMIAIVAVSFMEVRKGPTIVRGFAVAAMFWLIVLLGLGSADALTRTNYYVTQVRVN